MEQIVETMLNLALLVHLLLLALVVWRVWRGENVVDRLAGAFSTASFPHETLPWSTGWRVQTWSPR